MRVLRPAWQAEAACRGAGAERFFLPERSVGRAPTKAEKRIIADALELCSSCPVTRDCYDYGLEQGHGAASSVWGGHYFTVTEVRRRLPQKKAA